MGDAKYQTQLVVEEEEKVVANAYPGPRTEGTKDRRTRVRASQRDSRLSHASSWLTPRYRESLASPKYFYSLLLSCRAGNARQCKQVLSMTDQRVRDVHMFPGRNMQSILYNGGPSAFAWGSLIVISGALAQSASIAEMASAQSIAGAQYVRIIVGLLLLSLHHSDLDALQHWTHAFAPANSRRFITWMQGWITWFVLNEQNRVRHRTESALGSAGSLLSQEAPM
jgi:hypothetical protein